MKKFKLGRLAFAFLSLVPLIPLAGATTASAAMVGIVRPSILGGINEMTNNGGSLGYSVGLDLAFWLGPTVDLTIGGMYLSRAFTNYSNVNYVQIPAILFLHLGPMFSVGGGGFDDLAVTSNASTNYGLTGAVKIKPVLFPLFVEGHYNYGLNTTNWGSNTSEFQVLIGYSF